MCVRVCVSVTVREREREREREIIDSKVCTGHFFVEVDLTTDQFEAFFERKKEKPTSNLKSGSKKMGC